MTNQEPLSIAGAAFGVLFQLGLAFGLFAWARRVANARGGVFRKLQYLPLLGLCATFLGICITSVFLVWAFGNVADAPASSRAALLAEDIGAAMNATAVGLLATIALYVGSAVSSAVGTWGRGAKSGD